MKKSIETNENKEKTIFLPLLLVKKGAGNGTKGKYE